MQYKLCETPNTGFKFTSEGIFFTNYLQLFARSHQQVLQKDSASSDSWFGCYSTNSLLIGSTHLLHGECQG